MLGGVGEITCGKLPGSPPSCKQAVTRKLKEVSRFSRARQRQDVVHVQSCFLLIRKKNKCAARAKCLFLLIRSIVVFYPFSLSSPCL